MLLSELPAMKKLQKQNMQFALKKLILVERLRDETNINTILGFSILADIKSNKVTDTNILKSVKDHARNNRELVEMICGKELTEEIINLTLKTIN